MLERRKPLRAKPAKRGFWTCQGRLNGEPCKTQNPNRKRKCAACGSPKRVRRPKHMAALEAPYEVYVELNGGDHCAVCLRRRTQADERRLDRDHCHRTGRPRGLLCHKCNRALASWVTPEWLRAAADYLERFDVA